MNFLPEWTHLEVIVASALIASTVITTVSVFVCGAVFGLTGGLGRAPKAVAVPAPARPAAARPVAAPGSLAPVV